MEKPEFDVFQWANSVDEVKNNISEELFLLTKTTLRTKYVIAMF